MAARDATHYLLLNTDCEVRDPAWLQRMLAVHKEGATGLRYVTSGAWPRADGFCMLIDAHCWEDGLNEEYQWWWSITGLEARLLRQGRSVQAVKEYDRVVEHHGGKSGKAFQSARSASDVAVIAGWFEDTVTVVEAGLAAPHRIRTWRPRKSCSRSTAERSRSATPTRSISRAPGTPRSTSSATSWRSPTAR